MVLTPEAWKKKAAELTAKVNLMANDYTAIANDYAALLNDWEEVRDEAGDPGKHEVDDSFRALSDARSKLCALKGGSKRKNRRTRKNRR
jgi:hypothetical protein